MATAKRSIITQISVDWGDFMTEIRCSIEKEGFIAHYFPGTKEKNKAIIAVGGASCNEATCVAMSGYLRRAGYNVLVLGFYLWQGLSKNLARIPWNTRRGLSIG